ncbi:hypothetical protein TrRE_jg3106 [Triparma retinervis]|uniref:Uncharacterized protein n=1 Tax=Triparma retinervis TaxID=2557542 RepID=A0A9W6Z417_9STRA|nr:hypothetical protein TrRE_jg3106 [Triparma retinervis]
MTSFNRTESAEIRALTNELRSGTFRYSTSQTGNNAGGQPKLDMGETDNLTVDADDDLQPSSRMPMNVKMTFGAPQFSIFSIYMLISVHATLYYEYLGAKLSYLAFFTAFARSFDVLTDPLMSWWSDSTRTQYGRRR